MKYGGVENTWNILANAAPAARRPMLREASMATWKAKASTKGSGQTPFAAFMRLRDDDDDGPGSNSSSSPPPPSPPPNPSGEEGADGDEEDIYMMEERNVWLYVCIYMCVYECKGERVSNSNVLKLNPKWWWLKTKEGKPNVEKRKGIDRHWDRWAPIQNRKKTFGIPFDSAGDLALVGLI